LTKTWNGCQNPTAKTGKYVGNEMEIILVRHPETIAPKGMCYGRLDLELKESPSITKDKVVSQLVNAPDYIISSPLPRAKRLADEIAKHFGIKELETDERLMEMHFGDWEGKMWEELPKTETSKWLDDFVNLNAPNGESFVELQTRVMDFANEWWLHQELPKMKKLGIQKLLVVSHSAPIRVLICHKKSLPLEKAFRMKIDFGSVTYL